MQSPATTSHYRKIKVSGPVSLFGVPSPETDLSTTSPGLDATSQDGEEGKAESLGVGEVVLINEGPSATV